MIAIEREIYCILNIFLYFIFLISIIFKIAKITDKQPFSKCYFSNVLNPNCNNNYRITLNRNHNYWNDYNNEYNNEFIIKLIILMGSITFG